MCVCACVFVACFGGAVGARKFLEDDEGVFGDTRLQSKCFRPKSLQSRDRGCPGDGCCLSLSAASLSEIRGGSSLQSGQRSPNSPRLQSASRAHKACRNLAARHGHRSGMPWQPKPKRKVAFGRCIRLSDSRLQNRKQSQIPKRKLPGAWPVISA